MSNAFKIIMLKNELKSAYTELMTMETYGTGNAMFNYVTGEKLYKAKARVNAILKELSAIDPNCPKQLT